MVDRINKTLKTSTILRVENKLKVFEKFLKVMWTRPIFTCVNLLLSRRVLTLSF